jgi:peptide-methionine (S)-S-oxide reductase
MTTNDGGQRLETATLGGGCFWCLEAVFERLEGVEISFAFHDPTTLNRQENDVGTQYRSTIYYHSPEQERTAREVIEQLRRDGTWDDAIVTEVTPLDRFYPAE